MEIHTLVQFKKVAELQHITRASEELHVAQPSLSRTIAQLEKELGVQLFERVGKSIALNRYGEIVLKHTNKILKELKDIETEIQNISNASQRTVTLSMYSASKLLPGLVTAFKRQYPSIRLMIRQENPNEAVQDEIDLTIFSSIRPSTSRYAITLIEEEIFLALPEWHPLSTKDSVSLKEVSASEFICLQKGKSLRTITDTYCKMAGFEPSVILESDSPETVRELIAAGIGISFVPSITWQNMNTDNIVLLPISYPQCKRYINLSWRSNGRLSTTATLLKDFIQQYFEQYRK